MCSASRLAHWQLEAAPGARLQATELCGRSAKPCHSCQARGCRSTNGRVRRVPSPDRRVLVPRAAELGTAPCLQPRARPASRRCNVQQAPSTCAGTSTRGQRGKYGVPADPRLDPLALSHPSRRGSSFFGSPLPLLYFLCFHSVLLHIPSLPASLSMRLAD